MNRRLFKASWRHIVLVLLLASGVAGLAFFVWPAMSAPLIYTMAGVDSAASVGAAADLNLPPPEPAVVHLLAPEPLKAIYMTQCVVGTPSFRADLVKLIDETELNSVIIDLKDYSGGIAFTTATPALAPYVSLKCGAADMKDFVASLHAKNIYVIGRITVFQDPLYTAVHPELAVKRASDGAVWKDKKGLAFIDVGARPFWDYIVTLAQESYRLGFDELNFDYVRYPSDGDMRDIAFTHSDGKTKAEQLEEFFAYLHDQLQPTNLSSTNKPIISADLFGMTTTNTDDLNIGQVLERALPYFDYIAPMIYPSHYPRGFNNWANPNEHIYEVIKLAMDSAVARTVATTTPVEAFGHERMGTSTPAIYRKAVYDKNKIRPWLQDFDYGGNYGPTEVRAQIKATYDAGLTSWMLWAPSNRYTREALESQ